MKTKKLVSIFCGGLSALVMLFILMEEVRAETTTFLDPGTTSTSGTSSTNTDPSGNDSTSSASSSTTGDPTSAQPSPMRDKRFFERRKNKRIYELGMCVGQTLAKQGVYFSDVASGATTGTAEDLKTAIKAARQTCEEQNQVSPSASPTPTPDPSASPSPTPTATSTPSAS